MIVMNNVSFEYDNEDRKSGVYNINLYIPKGQVVMLCGPSGCGKTTIARLISGLAPLYYSGDLKGRVLIDGENVEEINELKVGSIFQNPRTQFFNVNTTDEIAFGCENAGVDKEEIYTRIAQVTRELNMEYLLDKNLFTLSAGEKQKIACASVAAMEPEIFILDEPSSNMDLSTILDLKALIEKWKKRGKTVIVAEHRLYYLTTLADRVIYMKEGRIGFDIPMEKFTDLDVETLHKNGLRSQRTVYFFPKTKRFSEKDILHFKNLSFSYGKKFLLHIPEISVPAGAVIAVLGYNGAGKSAFAKAICGFERGAGGVLYYKGKRFGTGARKRLSYMIVQDVNSQLFTESVLEEIMLSMDDERDDVRLEAEVILHELDLEMFQDSHPMSLSEGEKRRVAFTSAIAMGKEIIILDEPSGGLDYRYMMEMSKTLKKLSREGRTIFLITHDPELLKECCDYLIFLDNGNLAWSGEWTRENTQRVNEFFEGI